MVNELDHRVAEACGLIYDVIDGDIYAWRIEEPGGEEIVETEFCPSRDIVDARWAARLSGLFGFDDVVCEPLVVCAAILQWKPWI